MTRKTQYDRIITLLIGFCILLFFFFYFNNNVQGSNLSTAKLKFEICMIEAARIYNKEATKFFEEFSHCIKTYISIKDSQMDNLSNDVFGEKKMFLPMSSDYAQERCKWLTVGVGGVTAAEELFKQKYPTCSIFGVEPADAGNFSTIGKLIPYGAGLEDAETQLMILENGKYISKTMKVLRFTKILDEFLGSRFLHYLTIDIEGFEYGILRELIGDGQFAKDGIVICQIDAELHNPKFSKAHESIKQLNPVQFILDFLNHSSPYIPIYNVPYLKHPHQKVTFVNIVDPECRKAFNIESYFSGNKN